MPIFSDLKPGTWYSLQLTAHNGAGSRVVTTQFATLSLSGDLNYGDDDDGGGGDDGGDDDDDDDDDDAGDDDDDDGGGNDDDDDNEKQCFAGQTLLPRIGSTPGTSLDQVDLC